MFCFKDAEDLFDETENFEQLDLVELVRVLLIDSHKLALELLALTSDNKEL